MIARLRPSSVVALAIALVAACGGEPAVPELTDPIAILEAAATQAATSQSVHVDIAADGALELDLLGTGSAAPIDLTESTVALDLGIADGTAKATFALPGLLGLRGELIAVDGATYIKTTLTGPLYQKSATTAASDPGTGGSPDPSAIAEMVGQLRETLERPGVDPVKGEDVACGSATCYTVTIQLTPAELAALDLGPGDLGLPGGLPVPVPDLGDQTIDLTIRVDKLTTRLAGLTVAIGGGATGDVTAELTFSKWGDDLTITAPPVDQVSGG
ncbi:MAG: hypothetical protein ABIP77_05985 [Candidatus Limnocylindrales bacterium]